MPSLAKSLRARSRGSTGLPKKRRGSRRSRCTGVSADVRVSAALIAAPIASKSGSPRSRRVHLGRFAMALPVSARATAARRAPAAREAAVAPATPPAPPAPAPIDGASGVPPPAPPAGLPAPLTRGLGRDAADRGRREPEKEERVEVGGPLALPLPTPKALALTLELGRRGRPARRDPGVDRVRRGLEPGGVAPLLETRRDDLADDLAGGGIGHDRLETVADLEAQLPVLSEDHEEHAIVEPLLAEPPLLEEPVGDVLEALALERAEDRDRHLGTRGALVSGELRLEPRALGSREQPRVIVHAGAGSGWEREGDGEECRQQQARTSPWARSPRPPWPRRRPWPGSLRGTRRRSRGTGAGACCSRAPPR